MHAGEGFGPESIWQAIRDLHAERIGHGFHIFSTDQVVGEKHKHNAEVHSSATTCGANPLNVV